MKWAMTDDNGKKFVLKVDVACGLWGSDRINSDNKTQHIMPGKACQSSGPSSSNIYVFPFYLISILFTFI